MNNQKEILTENKFQKFNITQPIYCPDSDNLQDVIKALISSHNAWCEFEKLIKEIPILKEKCEEEREDMLRGGNCSAVSYKISALRELLYDLKCYKEDEEKRLLDNTQDNVNKLKKQIKDLEKDNKELRSQLDAVKRIISGGN